MRMKAIRDEELAVSEKELADELDTLQLRYWEMIEERKEIMNQIREKNPFGSLTEAIHTFTPPWKPEDERVLHDRIERIKRILRRKNKAWEDTFGEDGWESFEYAVCKECHGLFRITYHDSRKIFNACSEFWECNEHSGRKKFGTMQHATHTKFYEGTHCGTNKKEGHHA